MPASLHRLAGKSHPFDSQPAPLEENQNAVPTNDPEPEVVNNNVSIDLLTATEEATVDNENTTTVADKPKWDPSWSKTQLLAVATQLNLGVTSFSTKSQIIDALTAAIK